MVLLLTDDEFKFITTVSSASNFVSDTISNGIVVVVDNAAISAVPSANVKSSAEAEPSEGFAE